MVIIKKIEEFVLTIIATALIGWSLIYFVITGKKTDILIHFIKNYEKNENNF